MSEIIPDDTLDVRGECCPYPLILTKKRVEQLKSGEILLITADDPVAPQNIDSWAKKSGNKILAVKQDGKIFNVYVQRIYVIVASIVSSIVKASLPQSTHDTIATPLMKSALLSGIRCLQLGHLY